MAFFSSLGEKINHAFSKLTNRGKLTELEIKYGKTNLRQKTVDFHNFLFEETVNCDKILADGNHVPRVEERKAELDFLLSDWSTK